MQTDLRPQGLGLKVYDCTDRRVRPLHFFKWMVSTTAPLYARSLSSRGADTIAPLGYISAIRPFARFRRGSACQPCASCRLSRAGGAPSSFPSLVRPWNRCSLRREHTGSPLSMLPPLAGQSGSPLFGQNSSPITTPRPAIGLQICQHTLVMDPCRCKLHGGMSTGPRAPSGWRGTTIGNSVRPSCRWCRVSGLPRRPPD